MVSDVGLHCLPITVVFLGGWKGGGGSIKNRLNYLIKLCKEESDCADVQADLGLYCSHISVLRCVGEEQ